jgi:hypothetical protein
MTYQELEALENGAREATAYASEVEEVPLTRKLSNVVIGGIVLLAAGMVVLLLVIWRAQ